MTEGIKLNANVLEATVEDWASNELIRFEGEGCADKAIEWREEQGHKYASLDNGREVDPDSEEYEERLNSQLEDLYVIGYDVDGNKTGVQFG